MNDLLKYIDAEHKTIHLVGEVNEEMYMVVQTGISRLCQNPGAYTFTMNSFGGNLHDGMAIYDLIKSCCAESKIVVYGACMSAAMIILQACDDRIAAPNAEFMIHYGQETNESGEEKRSNDRLGNTMRDILYKRSKVKKATMTRWVNNIKHLDAQNALKNGLIDKIIEADSE